MKQNPKFTLYMGLNDKDSKQQEISTLDAYKITANAIMKYFGGATITESTGIYKHADTGTFVVETSYLFHSL